jgi:hypothetical protein
MPETPLSIHASDRKHSLFVVARLNEDDERSEFNCGDTTNEQESLLK